MDKPVLFVQPFAIFDRRVLAYLHEKGIEEKVELVYLDHTLSAAGKPPGQSPILRFGKGEDEFIPESLAIIEYLEDVYDDSSVIFVTTYPFSKGSAGSIQEREQLSFTD